MQSTFSTLRPGWLRLPSGRNLSENAFFWILQFSGWTLFGLVMLEYDHAFAWQAWQIWVKDDLVLASTGFALTATFRFLYRYCKRNAISARNVTILAIVLSLCGSPVWYGAQAIIPLSPFYGSDDHGRFFTNGLFLYYLFILATWNLLYFGINGWIKLKLERTRAERAEERAQSARLRALQAQLEPHFLFNALNGISSLIVERKHEAATTMISLLSDFLRLTLRMGSTLEITVLAEVGFLNRYLQIQKMRFGQRLNFRIDVAEEASSALVPTLLLQPLVENAVKHGILPREPGGLLIVTIRVQDGNLNLRVEDDGPGMNHKPSLNSGVGLSNTATRLHDLYGNRATLHVSRGQLGGASVDIVIPLRLSTGVNTPDYPEQNALK